MSGPRPEIRRVRAWLCFYLARAVLPEDEFPRDEGQIVREDLVIPGVTELLNDPKMAGRERELVRDVLGECGVV